MNVRISLAVLLTFILAEPSIAQAGMPMVTLSDLARLRLSTISFFLLGILLSAKALQWLWNSLTSDVNWLPTLTYKKALGATMLWGLLFVIVLTMISGARELMTPGAWVKKGVTYQLADATKEVSSEEYHSQIRNERFQKLLKLNELLQYYAKTHDGKFPIDKPSAQLADAVWQVPRSSGVHYLYFKNRTTSYRSLPLVCEPNLFEDGVMVLFTDGKIKTLPIDSVTPLLPGESK